MDDDNITNNLPIQKVTISGPTLSSLLNHLTSSPGPTTGLLLGDFSLHTPTSLSDDPPSLSPPPSFLIATVTGLTAVSPTSPLPHSLRRPIIGWFSARRLSPLRPSLLDHSLFSHPASPTPFIFILLTTPPSHSSVSPIHTHDYRAYHFQPASLSFETLSIEIVNIGPGFRGQYGLFSPKSGLPWLPCVAQVGSPMREDNSKSLSEMKRAGNDEKELKGYVAEGYGIDSLTRLIGSDAVGYMGGVEELYEKMLGKLQGLARVAEASSDRVLELENHNMKLRRRVAGVE